MIGSVYMLFLLKGNKRKEVNQKPNTSSCLTFSETVMNYVWYQAALSKKCRSNCLIFEIALAFICTDQLIILNLKNVASII